MLAYGIQRLAGHYNNPNLAVEPLYLLVARFPPNASYLTNLHPMFLHQCITSQHYTLALPILENPITEVSLSICPELTYTDNLMYHYLGGIIFTLLKKWSAAEESFEICVTSPSQGTVVAALQLEALKKLRLVQLISKGYVSPLPKYTNPLLIRLLKNTPYNTFINAYPSKIDTLHAVLDKERQLFATVLTLSTSLILFTQLRLTGKEYGSAESGSFTRPTLVS